MPAPSETNAHSERVLVPQSVFIEKLNARGQKVGFACVGLDTDIDSPRFPEHIERFGFGYDVDLFNRGIIESVYDLSGTIKINSAFYEGLGSPAFATIRLAIQHIREKDPEIPIIWDAKRGDIGNTNNGYAKLAFDHYGVDAITLHPFLGSSFLDDAGERQLEALAPFLEREDKGMFILVRTSNPSAGELQDLPIDITKLTPEYRRRFGDMDELREMTGQDVVPLYQILAYKVAKHWNKYGNCGVVVGATYPEEIAAVRSIIGDMPMLIPGVGAQGGDLEKAVKAGINSKKAGILINNSRGIIFKSSGSDFAEAARGETRQLRDGINAAIAA